MTPNRRILALWFPRLGAERLIRAEPHLADRPLATAEDRRGMQLLVALSDAASAAGLRPGQPLRDAQAICPDLVTRRRDAAAEAAFLAALRRWAGRFSPWVAEEPPDGLMLDLSGCAHLFGGEAALVAQAAEDAAGLGLGLRPGLADTVGAAWALARFGGGALPPGPRSGDAIDQEAWATRSRAARRPQGARAVPPPGPPAIAPPGGARAALAPLPVAALRLPEETVEGLTRLGLRRIGDLWGQPRAALARRFGPEIVRRLDQALGLAAEPLRPARPEEGFAVRMALPEPIGREDDLLAAIDRLLPRLCERLARKGKAARRVRLECHRTDRGIAAVEVGLARPAAEPGRIRPLLALKLAGIDAGFGIDLVRLVATPEEDRPARRAEAMDDLVGRLGARLGMEAITRRHPADSHLPERASTVMAAAWSEPAADWPPPPAPRPLLLWRPEPVLPAAAAGEAERVPARFRWRGRDHLLAGAEGPERIAPEWWFDDPDWRSGVRDYWQVTTARGERLWLYFAHGDTMSPGWFCHGSFA